MSEKTKENFVTDEIINEWYEKAKHIDTPEKLKEFIEYVYSFDGCDYNSETSAVTAIAVAASWCAEKHYGLTGFQGGWVGLQYLLHWTYDGRDMVGISIRDWTNMLYPQYQEDFEKIISKDMFKILQEKATEKLKEKDELVNPKVLAHWQSIVDGIVPFGYELVDFIL